MKTIEEEAREFGRIVGNGTGNIDCANTAMDGFEAGAIFAQRWIPVEEELPDKNWYKCLVKYNDDSISITHFQLSGGFINYKSDLSFITHWRPIELK